MAFTNLERVVYPSTGFTKGDVIKYYFAVAPWLLPHLKERPVTLKRYPQGIRGEAFYEKDAPGHTPAWVKTFPVPRRDGGEPIRYIVINSARTLAWCANYAAIELHPFLHRVPRSDRPTHVALDLDPGEGTDLVTCREVALLLKKLLDALKLKSFAKVSGSKGLQLYVPLNRPVTYAATQAFARTLAELLHREHPDLVVSEMSRQARRGRVFIDWSQNADFKTTVGVYSLRAKRDEPYVSMPITWDELKAAKSTTATEKLFFSPEAALRRLKKVGDLFAPVLTLKQQLPPAFSAAAEVAQSKRSRHSTAKALQAYDEKRDFTRTAEPAPVLPQRSTQGSRRRFVIQKHAASHLHYDFRLEMNDTLRSWAVPKGLPYSTDDRRSAFATEDHPLDYLSFEGVIPEGQYGGGTVMVWDLGTYDVIEGNYWKGFLRVFVRGKKLRGEWALQRVADEKEKARWIITKGGKSMRPISAQRDDESVLSGLSMVQIAAARSAVWQSNRAPEESLPDAAETLPRRSTVKRTPPSRPRRGKVTPPRRSNDERPIGGDPASPPPEFVPPMTAREVPTLPTGEEWTYEIKWDGYRALVAKHGKAVRIYSRKENNLSADFPSVVAATREIHAGSALIDGEIVALDRDGKPSFTLLQNRAKTARDHIVLYAFDLLQLDGEDWRERPLVERKARLELLVSGTSVRLSPSLAGTPGKIVAEVAKLGLEGVIAKKRSSSYARGKESGAWLKFKLSPEQEFVIGGYKPGNPVESLVVGYYDGPELMCAGKVRQGLNPRLRAELGRAFATLRVEQCPFANLPNSRTSHFGEGITAEQMKELHWLKPRLIAQVSFNEWTPAGNLRHGTFKGLREDKDPRDVVRES